MGYDLFISWDFLGQLAKLPPKAQKQTNKQLDLLRANPKHPSLELKKPKGAVDGSVYKARATLKYRMAVYPRWSDKKIAVLWIDDHDKGNEYAADLKVEFDPFEGAIRLVGQSRAPAGSPDESMPSERSEARGTLFRTWEERHLRASGIPAELIPELRELRDDGDLDRLLGRVDDDLGLRLIEIFAGQDPESADAPEVLATPKAGRPFVRVSTAHDLSQLLDAPLERWIHFLHPSQREIVTGCFKGPLCLLGGAGTGKTVVAVHRAVHLVQEVFPGPDDQVLLTTFSQTLAHSLRHQVDVLCGDDPARSRIRVENLHHWCLGEMRRREALNVLWEADTLDRLFDEAIAVVDGADQFVRAFYQDEYRDVVWAHDVRTKDAYLRVSRKGRGTPIRSRAVRLRTWRVFEAFRERLQAHGLTELAEVVRRTRVLVESGEIPSPFRSVIVDEVQDFSPEELRLIAALVDGDGPSRLLLCGDGRQRIYPGGYSLRALGIDVRGTRTRHLRINYRTTTEIRRFADDLLAGTPGEEVDGSTERRRAVSLLSGPQPRFQGYDSVESEIAAIAEWLSETSARPGYELQEVAVFCPYNSHLKRMRVALEKRGIDSQVLAPDYDPLMVREGACQLATMHRAKGLEFKAVAVAHVTSKFVPPARALGRVADEAARAAVVRQSRRLIHVAMTRARDAVLVSWHGAPSPVLDPVLAKNRGAG